MDHDRAALAARLPLPFGSWAEGDGATSELGWLRQADFRGVTVAPMAVVPVAVEVDFYRLNDLPRRLRALFAGVDLGDPDEEDLEDIAPAAAELLRSHALLDEVIESFYQAMAGLPTELELRREGGEGGLALRGRPALLALKRIWAADWSFEALSRRLRRGGTLAPQATAVLIHAAGGRPDAGAGRAASEALGRPLQAWADPEGRLTRLAPG